MRHEDIFVYKNKSCLAAYRSLFLGSSELAIYGV